MPTAGIGISPAVATMRDTPNTLERASHGTPTAPDGADVVRIGGIMTDTYYVMTDAELLEVRKGIQASLDEPNHAEQKEKGIADKWNSADGLNELASCTLALKNRIYPWLVDFDIIEAIANYGYGLTDGRKDAVNLGYRVLSKWLKDHGMDKPKVVNGIHNREQNLRDILDGMGGWIKAENMNGYTRIVPPDRKRRKQANQPAPPAIDAYRVWWMLLNGGSEVRVYTPDDAEPMNPYKGLVGLTMEWFTLPEPEPEPEPPPMAVYCGPLPPEVYDYRRSLRGRALLAEFRKAGYKSKTAGRALIKAVGGQNIHLYGKQGTGKSNTPKDIAEFLGLPRVVIGFNSMAELVIGYLDVNGKQVWTPFLKAITSPCILQFDENDRQTDDVQDAILGILSDGYITLADGTCIQRHPMCYLIATGNHPLQYPHTREAYGDRFRQIEVVYESEIAREIVQKYDCGDIGMELVEFLEDFEKQRVAQELDGAQVSYRPLVRMLRDLVSDDGDTLQQIISENLIQGALDAEQCRRIGMNMRVHNRFTDALMKM